MLRKSINKYHLYIFITLGIGILLRLYGLTQVPPALHGDELGTGYNAYSLIKTGVDEYGKSFPLTFRNDFSPLIFYATLPYVWVLGLNEFSTRLPTAIVGILLIPLVYFITKVIFKEKKLALLSMFFLAISSWEIRFSRTALEMIWAVVFQMIGILFFIKSRSKNNSSLLIAFFSFFLSVIAYQSAKFTTPLLLINLFLYDLKLFKKNWRLLTIYSVAFIILPIIGYFLIRPFKEMRFVGISVFTVWKNSLPPHTSFITPINIINLFQTIIINYLKHFDPTILFFDNSRLRYFQVIGSGMFYPWQIVGLLVGTVVFIQKISLKTYRFLLIWIFISPIPAAFTTGVPFANIGRNLLMFPALEIVCAIGILTLFRLLTSFLKPSLIFVSTLVLTFIVGTQMNNFLFNYFTEVPVKFALFWGQPLKETIPTLSKYEPSVNSIIITDTVKQSYMYLLFYGLKEPQWLLKVPKIRNPVVGYSKIGLYEFRSISWEKDQLLPNVLLIGTPQEIPDNDKIIYEVKQDNQQVLLRVVKT